MLEESQTLKIHKLYIRSRNKTKQNIFSSLNLNHPTNIDYMTPFESLQMIHKSVNVLGQCLEVELG